jgi:hypothetical protein
MDDNYFREDQPDEPCRQIHFIIFVGESMLDYAHFVAQKAKERLEQLLGEPPPLDEQ